MKTSSQLIKDLVPKKFSMRGKLWVIFLLSICVAGIIAYIDQVIQGQKVTNMNDYALWGIYISNFVFFVATSFVGAVTVALLRLSGMEWRTPLVRLAGIIALASIIMAGVTITIDMARPDRIMNLFIHARLQSPITWDIIIIPSFIVASMFLLYFPLLPDLAILKTYYSKTKPRLSRIYGWLSRNWSGSERQWILQKRSVRVIAIAILPLALILQTIDAWLFSTTYRIGWDSTNFAPYFISGAMVAGLGGLICVICVVRHYRHLEDYITLAHFDKMGKLLVLALLVYGYFNINEYVVPLFTAKKGETEHLNMLFKGDYSGLFWFVTIAGLVIPMILLLFKKVRKPFPMFLISLLVVVGSWWKRYVIVTPTLLHPFIPIQGVPERWHHYSPSIHEWLITFATLAMALLIITVLVRYLPSIPIQRTAEEKGIELNLNDINPES